MNGFKKDLTKGPIAKTLLVLALPIFLGNVLQTAYNITDTFWVGRLGAEALAAVSISFPIIFLLISFSGGFAMAGTILVAQYRGKNDKRMVDFISEQTLIMLLIAALFFTALGYFLSEPLVRLMGAEEMVIINATSYMQMSFLGFVFVLGFFGIQALLRGVGEVKIPIYIVLTTVLLNFILDPLFIFGYGPIPAFGVAGAALATIGTQSIATILGLIVLFGGKYDIHIRKKHIKPDFKVMKRIFRLGIPTSIEQISRSLMMTIMTVIVVGFGTVSTAAFGIGIRIFSFILIPAFSIAMSTTTLVGQNLGAKKTLRAEKTAKTAMILGFFLLMIAAVFIYIYAESISAIFIPSDQAVIETSAHILRIMSFGFGFLGVELGASGAIRGAGKTKITMLFSLFNNWIVGLPLAIILAYVVLRSSTGIWLSYPISGLLGAIVMLTYFFKGPWKNYDVTSSKQNPTE